MKTKHAFLAIIAALVASVIISVSVLAQQQGGGGQNPPPEPPQEAITACNGKAKGKTCQIQAPQGTVTGTCQDFNQQLVCVPEGGPPSDGGQPPAR
ncbi:MAG: hypothetical protein N5P05_000609 [Chroococcopsis gigantea SAG 12.99]|jgi:hypothetical protein|nr:hypothetical protein [Chroococcopsis gigantea SAG 12.99]